MKQVVMEDWEVDFNWLRVRHFVKDQFGKESLPDMNAILLLIGIQELGKLQHPFSKEEKQDLMHIAVCRLLSYEGYYEFEGIDDEGWPHWKMCRAFQIKGEKAQEDYMKEQVVRYFKEMELI